MRFCALVRLTSAVFLLAAYIHLLLSHLLPSLTLHNKSVWQLDENEVFILRQRINYRGNRWHCWLKARPLFVNIIQGKLQNTVWQSKLYFFYMQWLLTKTINQQPRFKDTSHDLSVLYGPEYLNEWLQTLKATSVTQISMWMTPCVNTINTDKRKHTLYLTSHWASQNKVSSAAASLSQALSVRLMTSHLTLE